jgi:hypothetical protein
VAAWGFGEGSGTTTADAAGGDNPGTLVGPAWTVQGRYGTALNFDGTNDYVAVADADDLDLTTALTLEAWINPTQLASYRVIMSKTLTGQPTNYYLATFDDELAFGFYAGGVWREHVTSGVGLVPGAWQHVAAVYSDAANVVRLYVNGGGAAGGGRDELIGRERGPAAYRNRFFERGVRGADRRGAGVPAGAQCGRDRDRPGHAGGGRADDDHDEQLDHEYLDDQHLEHEQLDDEHVHK